MHSPEQRFDGHQAPGDRAARYREVTQLFDAVRDLEPDAARAKVAEHPSSAVRDEVLAMLDADRGGAPEVRTIVDVSSVIAEASAAPEIPSMVGEYAIKGLLGQGGGGVVLRGVCPKSGQDVAIKVLGIGAWSSRALGRFRQEIKLLGHLSHPGIARILDAGTDRSGVSPHPYFVMEFVDGPTLSAWRRETQRSTREIVALFAEIVEALAFSHARGITHRDLKPGNVLVTREGRPKILDFGVATVARTVDPSLDPLRTLTLTLGMGQATAAALAPPVATGAGGLVGTLPYMSPEQLVGTQLVDARSDLYSIGVMMYEVLTGKLPYEVSTGAITEAALAIRNEIPTSIGRIDRTLRGDLEVIVARLLEKRPVDRYQNAQELLDDLERYLRGQRTRARPLPLRVRVGRFARRYPAYLAASAALALVAVGSLAYAGYLLATERMEREKQAIAVIDAMRRDLSSAAFEIGKGQVGTSRRSLDAVAEPERNWAWRALDRYFNKGALVSFVFYGATDIKVRGDSIFVREAEDGAQPATFDLAAGVRRTTETWLPNTVAVAVSPDGLRVVRGYAADGSLFVRSARDGVVLDVIPAPFVSIDAMDWSGDGETIVVANRRGELAAVDLATGAVQRTRVAWSAADRSRVTVRAVGGLVVAALEGEESVVAWRVGQGPSETPRILPLGGPAVKSMDAAMVDGSPHAAVGTMQGSVIVIDPSAGSIVRKLGFAASPVEAISVEPLRGLVAAGLGDTADARRGTIRVWDLATGEVAGSIGLQVALISVGFSRDGETLCVGDFSGALMRYSVPREVLSPAIGGPSFKIDGMAFANDERMAVSTAEGVFWWNWSRDRQASRARPERWPVPSDATAGRPFAVLTLGTAASSATREAFLAVVDSDSGTVRFYSESGSEVGRAAINAAAPRGAQMSIASTDRGFLIGAGTRVLSYTVLRAGNAIEVTQRGFSDLGLPVRGVSATPDGRRAVVTISANDGRSPSLVGISIGTGGVPEQDWVRALAEVSEVRALRGAVASDGSCAVAVTGVDEIAVYEMQYGSSIFVARDFAPWNIDRDCVDVCMSPDGSAMALRLADGSVRIVEASAASRVASMQGGVR